jgi:hypothetical protein
MNLDRNVYAVNISKGSVFSDPNLLKQIESTSIHGKESLSCIGNPESMIPTSTTTPNHFLINNLNMNNIPINTMNNINNKRSSSQMMKSNTITMTLAD